MRGGRGGDFAFDLEEMMRRPSACTLLAVSFCCFALAGGGRAAEEVTGGAEPEAAPAVAAAEEEPEQPSEPALAPEGESQPEVTDLAPPAAAEWEAPEIEPLPEPLAVPAPIASIEIVGNEEISEEQIRAAITSEVGGQFSEEQVAQDRETVLNLGWFQTVAVERESVESGIRLVFRVTENPVIEEIEFEGIRELTGEELLAAMDTKPGQVYNAPRLARDAQAVEDLYRSKGYILAIVVGQRMPENVLTLIIAEGEIETIKITGNTHTKTYMIRRYIRTNEGETYNDRKVAADVARLSGLGWFETVRRDAEVGTEPGKVIVVITVVEKRKTGMASVGGGYSSVQGAVGFVDLVKTNIGGIGQTVKVRGEFGGRTSYEFGYSHPWVMTPETRLNLGIYNRLIVREAFVTDEVGQRRSILYDERRSGGNLTLGRPLSDHTTVYLRLRRDDVSISGLTAEEEPFLTGAAFEPREVRSVTVAAANDTRRGTYNPLRGSYQQFSAEFAGVIGGVDFNKYVTDNRRFFPVGDDKAIAVRLLAGLVTGDAPYLEQFLIGGSESLRGYRSDRFVGTRMAILNTEYRFPLGSNLLGVAFVDVGDAWGGPVASDPVFEDVVHDSFTAHVGYGIGVRVRTPIGPLRLDLGFSEEGTETHFGVQHMF